MRVGIPLFASLSLNALLVAAAAALWLGRDEIRSEPATHSDVMEPLQSTRSDSTPQARTPIQWSAIEASDYTVLVTNLRSIGCPEQTIRDIVLGRIDREFDAKTRVTSNRSEGSQGNGSSIAFDRDTLRQQKMDVISALFGSPERIAASSDDARSSQQGADSAENEAVVPLALASAPGLKFQDEQLSVLENVRAEFIKSIGGLDQNPSDPEYLRRWVQAQAHADERIRTLLGAEVYQNLQLAALHQ